MTAYVNDEQKKEGAYGKAVKATLAATLAAGMVPAAAAFADEPAEASEANGIETLSVSPENAFKAGKVTAAEDNEGNAIADLDEVSFAADGKAHFVVPTEFTPEQGKAIDVTDAKKYEAKYYVFKDGKKSGNALAADTIVNPGSYCVTVTDKASGTESDIAATFTIGSASLKDATLVEGSDVEDTEFVYTGQAIDLGLELNGEMVDAAKYSVEYHAKGSASSSTTAPTNAGEYVAVVTGKDIYKGQRVEIAFTIAKLDLSKADIKLDPAFKGGNLDAKVTIESIDNIKDDPGTADVNELDAIASAKVVSVPDTIYDKGQGVYRVEVAAVADNANITGKQTVEVVKTLNDDAQVLYDGNALKNIDTDYSKEDTEVFDAAKLAAYDKNKKLIKDAKVNMVVREGDADGAIVENADLTKPGKWYVEVSVDAASTGYEYSSPVANFTVTVKDGSVNADADVFVKYDGEVTGDKTVEYTGEDLFKNVSVAVKSGDKTLVEGQDYEVELQVENENGEFVAADAMVDAGSYKVVVSSTNYAFKDEVAFTVGPKKFNPTNFRIDPADMAYNIDDELVFLYTGQAIVPVVQYQVAKDEYAALPEGSYTLTLKKKNDETGAWEEVEEAKEAGKYQLTVSDNDEDANHEFDPNQSKLLDFTVSTDKLFLDVPNDAWYRDYVYDAQKVGYMKGIGDSNMFAPNESTTRAMAATVLSRMVGLTGNDEASEPFSDVEPTDWYFKEVAWAASTGIVSGYPGTDEFRPNGNVTRAEFCVMMQRYAAATDQGVALEAGEADKILAAYEDGAAVEPWCKDAVAWAVKNEVFGGYSVLNPQGDITRAEMAKMAVAFQAEPLK